MNAPSAHPNETAQRILDAAEQIIDEIGEADLRVTEVAARSGVAVGLLYHYYKDRSDLVAAVRLHQYTRNTEADIAMMDEMLRAGATATAINNVAVAVIANLSDKERQRARRQRLAILAATEHNEELRLKVVARRNEISQRITDLIKSYQAAGYVDPDVDPVALTLLVEALPTGLALLEINPALKPSADGWKDLADRLISSVLPKK